MGMKVEKYGYEKNLTTLYKSAVLKKTFDREMRFLMQFDGVYPYLQQFICVILRYKW